MTTIQSLIVAPITFLLGIPHYLWYAHKSKPISLSLAYPLIDGILSSTSGSCPLEKPKVYLIGQGIDSKLFRVEITDNDKCIDLVHFGRIDESKGLIEIIELVKSKRSELTPYTLTLIGNPARNESRLYFDKLTKLSKDSSYREWLTIEPAIARGELTSKLKNFQVFIHNFNGSLDKTLLEATLCNLHIITSNREFIREFGKWDRKNQDSSLLLEFEAFFKLSSDERNKIKRNRVSYVLNNHSFDQWIKKTANILKSNRGN